MNDTTNTTNPAAFACIECFDTRCIDRGGAEIACPYCTRTVKLTGIRQPLSSVLASYKTITAHTATTITFTGTRSAILADARQALDTAELLAMTWGAKGRNHYTSTQVAILKRLRVALAN